MLKFLRWGLGAVLASQLLVATAAIAEDGLAGAAPQAKDVDAQGWWVVKDDTRRNIHAYARQEDDKRVRSFRVDGLIEGKAEDLMQVLLDFENYKKWFWAVREARLIKRVSPTEYYVYIVHKAPYPVADRDTVLHAKVKPQSRNDKRVILSVSAAPDYMPVQPSLVRMAAEEFTVIFTPVAGGRIETQVSGYIDPGGRVPAWAANFVQRSAPYHTMRGLQRMVQKPEEIERRQELPFPVFNFDDLDKIADR